MSGFAGFGGSVWKYRCRSSDQQKGARSGFRVIALYLPDRNTLYPLLIYAKNEAEQLPSKIVKKAIQELKQALQTQAKA